MIGISWSEPPAKAPQSKEPAIEYPEMCTVELDNRVQAARRVLVISHIPPASPIFRLRGAIAAMIRSFR